MCVGPHVGNVRLGKLLSTEPELKPVSEGGSPGRGWGLLLSPCCSAHTSVSSRLYLQLPHMPHISECLMKRSLKPADLRDMTVGQLQVIVNDLHSQIESKCKKCLKMGS